MTEYLRLCRAKALLHAPSVVKTKNGMLLLVCYGKERAGDINQLWFTRFEGSIGHWSPMVKLSLPGLEQQSLMNPVLWQSPDAIHLYFKVGESPQHWQGARWVSNDDGKSWENTNPLPPGCIGPTRNPPLLLTNGQVLMPSSRESVTRREAVIEHEYQNGHPHMVILGEHQSLGFAQLIQPALIHLPDGRIKALCRSNMGELFESISEDGGLTWTDVTKTNIPNPNSAIAVVQNDKGYYLAFNPSKNNRRPLWVAYFPFDGEPEVVRMIEPSVRSIAYPSLTFREETLVCVFTVNESQLGWFEFKLTI